MAQIYPDFYTIQHLHQPATEGELILLDFLQKNLNMEFEIYYHPFINGDRPNIVILKKGCGAIIISVNDWDLTDYAINDDLDWWNNSTSTKVQSPFSQINYYKENLVSLHISTFLEKKMNKWYYSNIIYTLVYFHKMSQDNIEKFIHENISKEDNKTKFLKDIKYIQYWGYDSLTLQNLEEYFSKIRIEQPSFLFDEDIYNNFKRYLKPPFHQLEEGIDIKYTKAQAELIRSESRPRRKIKGIAGSGKTLVLAKRAVNAYLRTNSEILILTFNLSLKNYIREKINDVRESYPWEKFYITNYHQFIKSEANNYNLPIKGLTSYTDINFFEPVKNHIKKYKAIFIDEVQDYQTEWLEIITKYFLYEDSEFVVFGDEKQNIYRRPLDENKEPVIKTIAGNWNKSLNASKRFTSEIGKLAMKFQHHFLESKYTIDDMVVLDNPILDFEQRNIKYANIGTEASIERIFNIYKGTCKKYCLNPADITILSGTADILREVEYFIKTQLKENTTTTFETKEEYDKSKVETHSKNNFEERINTIRRYRRNHFSIKTGTAKLSSIHSFKGWESHTVFLIIEPHRSDSIQDFESVELIYTAITRAQVNLFILNMGNEKYDSFFKENIQN